MTEIVTSAIPMSIRANRPKYQQDRGIIKSHPYQMSHWQVMAARTVSCLQECGPEMLSVLQEVLHTMHTQHHKDRRWLHITGTQ